MALSGIEVAQQVQPALLERRPQALADRSVEDGIEMFGVIKQERELKQVRFRHERRHHTRDVAELDAPDLHALNNVSLVAQLVVGV